MIGFLAFIPKIFTAIGNALVYASKHPKEAALVVLLVLLWFSYNGKEDMRETISEQTIDIAAYKDEITNLGGITATKDEIIKARDETITDFKIVIGKIKVELGELKGKADDQRKRIADSSAEAVRLQNELNKATSGVLFTDIPITSDCPAADTVDWALETILEGVQK